MKIKDYLILALLLLNTYLIVFNDTNQSSHIGNSDSKIANVENINDSETANEQLHLTLRHLLAETSSMKHQLAKLTQLNSKITALPDFSQQIHQIDNQSDSDKDSNARNQQAKELYATYDRQAKNFINEVLSTGMMDQNDVHTLRQRMSKMSPQEHDRELHRIIMALNNGDIELPPGVVF
ncbi:MAG: hypothetical protein HWE27_05665 [Gammaproteobacteria bacterium]|nr:hypothetical protein [Gammaproteobacteria bacterium]